MTRLVSLHSRPHSRRSCRYDEEDDSARVSSRADGSFQQTTRVAAFLTRIASEANSSRLAQEVLRQLARESALLLQGTARYHSDRNVERRRSRDLQR